MPTVTATVTWDPQKNKPVVTPDPIPVPSSQGRTTLIWNADDTILSFEIDDLSTAEFSDGANTSPKQFTAVDLNDTPGTYTYKVRATTHGGLSAEHDPKIENGSGVR